MTKELETINVGIVGHIDHGKTTLLHKLSGRWTDTHSEELKRGITIKLGYADVIVSEDNGVYNISGKGKAVKHVSFIDAPGHEMLMATMLSGAAMIDAAILVVAVNEGIKPQTREHLIALEAKGVKKLIVVQNKIDLVDEKRAEENYNEIKKLLKGRFDEAHVVPVSAQQNVNLDVLWEMLANLEVEREREEGDPLFIVARSFDINKPGTKPGDLKGSVLGGTLKEGKLKIGDEVEIKPGRLVKERGEYRYDVLKSKVSKLFRGSESVNELTPGGSMSIETELDMSIGKGDSLSGNVVSLTGKLSDAILDVRLKFELFKEVFGLGGHMKVEGIKPSETLMLSVNTSITGGNVKKVKGDEIDVSLKVPIVPRKGDTVGIARNVAGHWRLIGYGKIL
jgi:translation initiation factor 2 subunit 3